jgi:uncharacterized protein DUF4168
MKYSFPRSLAVALLISSAFIGAGITSAAESQKKPSAADETTISDRDLKSFVKAYVDYQKIRSSYGPALENTKDPVRKKQLEQEANAKIRQSLDATGLSPDRYNRIFAQVNSNESLRKKVLKQVEEERKKS